MRRYANMHSLTEEKGKVAVGQEKARTEDQSSLSHAKYWQMNGLRMRNRANIWPSLSPPFSQIASAKTKARPKMICLRCISGPKAKSFPSLSWGGGEKWIRFKSTESFRSCPLTNGNNEAHSEVYNLDGRSTPLGYFESAVCPESLLSRHLTKTRLALC